MSWDIQLEAGAARPSLLILQVGDGLRDVLAVPLVIKLDLLFHNALTLVIVIGNRQAYLDKEESEPAADLFCLYYILLRRRKPLVLLLVIIIIRVAFREVGILPGQFAYHTSFQINFPVPADFAELQHFVSYHGLDKVLQFFHILDPDYRVLGVNLNPAEPEKAIIQPSAGVILA